MYRRLFGGNIWCIVTDPRAVLRMCTMVNQTVSKPKYERFMYRFNTMSYAVCVHMAAASTKDDISKYVMFLNEHQIVLYRDHMTWNSCF